jgi:hypothetical protein
VLVAPDTVVTAGHCVCADVVHRVRVGASPGAWTGGSLVDLERVGDELDCTALNAQGDTAMAGRDVAILRLKRPIPASVAVPRRIATPDMLPERDPPPMRAVGFGRHDLPSASLGQKIHVDISVASARCRNIGDAQSWGCSVGTEMVAGATGLGKDTCDSGSGGPLFVWSEAGGDFFLAALTSRRLPGASCGHGGICSFVDQRVINRLRRLGASIVVGF